MSTLEEALKVDISRYKPVESSAHPGFPNQNASFEPILNSMLRCPLPPMQVSPDNLRQFYLNGQIPQIRLLTPATNNAGASSGGGSTVVNNTVTQVISGGSSSTNFVAKTATVTTPTINSGNSFQGSAMIAKSFELLSITATSPCEIRLYGSAAEQIIDLGRGLDVPTNAGTSQNIISDIALDTAPYLWNYQDRTGTNSDTPRSNLIYVTIFNLNVTSDVISVVIQYVPIES